MRALLLLTVLLLAGCAGDAGPPAGYAEREDIETFTLGPRQSVEWKLRLHEGSVLDYSWTATRPVAFDLHGDRGEGTDAPVSHKEGRLASDAGQLTVPFDGRHGWWFENRDLQGITVTLTTRGPYEVVGRTGGNAPP